MPDLRVFRTSSVTTEIVIIKMYSTDIHNNNNQNILYNYKSLKADLALVISVSSGFQYKSYLPKILNNVLFQSIVLTERVMKIIKP